MVTTFFPLNTKAITELILTVARKTNLVDLFQDVIFQKNILHIENKICSLVSGVENIKENPQEKIR